MEGRKGGYVEFVSGCLVAVLVMLCVQELKGLPAECAVRETALRARIAELEAATTRGDRTKSAEAAAVSAATPTPRSAVELSAEAAISAPCPSSPTTGLRSMGEIGAAFGSDKILVHRYHRAYELYLEPLRNKKLRVLEIGLGCQGLVDVGLGIRLWGEYLPQAQLDVIEYDADCVRRFSERNKKQKWGPQGGVQIHTGDQSNITFLGQVAAAAGPWDFIVDDGSHESPHQIASFKALWPHVTAGGVYAIEDLQTSFWGGRWGGDGTAVKWISDEIIPQVHTRRRRKNNVGTVDSKFTSPVQRVDCHHFVCLVTKRRHEQPPAAPPSVRRLSQQPQRRR